MLLKNDLCRRCRLGMRGTRVYGQPYAPLTFPTYGRFVKAERCLRRAPYWSVRVLEMTACPGDVLFFAFTAHCALASAKAISKQATPRNLRLSHRISVGTQIA